MTLQAQPEPFRPPGMDAFAAPGDTLALRRELRRALQLLAEARQGWAQEQQHREQLEAQLREGQLRESRSRHRAEHDDLTSLCNRAAFRERLGLALAAPGPVALMLLDLDDFKRINDSHGHAAGDEVLRIMAARMCHAVRSGDVLGRLGGDEFACLLPGASCRVKLAALADKLIESIAAPMAVAGQRLCLRASLGLALGPEDGRCPDSLLASADAAMYRAKRCGAGAVFFNP